MTTEPHNHEWDDDHVYEVVGPEDAKEKVVVIWRCRGCSAKNATVGDKVR